MAAFFPKGDSKLAVALYNFGNQIATVGAALGVSAADIKLMKTLSQNVVTGIQSEEQKKKDWQAAAKQVSDLKKTDLANLRKMIAHLKTNPAWNGTFAKTLGVVATNASGQISPATLETYKPKLRLSKQAGRVELRFTRGKLDGINAYMRKKGDATWRILDRVRYSPYVDITPATTPGTPEVREYRIVAVYKDKEVGQPSDIVSITAGE